MSIRSEIHIPDHEVLRKIGGGAYGEVWMARGVTGALRAVKIVWREDFEDDRGFEREFEGILKFEPISRDHPGFVNILHVGRGSDDNNPFYYYVMELGDDIHTGREINPVEYEARTLRSDLKSSVGKPLEVEFCLDVAGKLAEALKHLHELDLAHRDIKPANVIFVDGKAKLADIGLVASRGQQTFVGTEGFVPPEGPGSGQADVYGLGKVLYEMATGKDRLQFPELPDRLPESSNRKQWLALNRVICSVCEPKLSKRAISSAKHLSEAIAKIRQGKRVRERRILTTKRWVLSMLMCIFGFALYYYKPWNLNKPVVVTPPLVEIPKYENEMCSVQFITNPLRAKVFENGLEVDEETPTAFRQYPPGTKVLYRFEKPGYMTLEKEYVIPDKKYHIFPTENLSIFLPPKENEEWIDSLGVRYFPRIGFHESGYIQEKHFKQFLAIKPKVNRHHVETFSERGNAIRIVLMNRKTADAYARWIEDQAKEKGLLREDQYVIAKQTPDLLIGPADIIEKRKQLKLYPTVCIAKKIPYATVDIKSDPEGARVFVDGEWLGVTPMVAEKIRPQKIEIVLRKDGYKGHTQEIDLSDDEQYNFSAKLKQNNGVVMKVDWEEGSAPHQWTNSAGVKLMQFTTGKMVSAWEVRIKDYMEFTQNIGHRLPKDPLFPQTPNHPIVGVSKQDAIAYCKWLTEKDRKADRIGPEHEYRLPTDQEWSQLCGLDMDDEKGDSPAERYLQAQLNPKLNNVYPWGTIFPPRRKVANLADAAAAKAIGVKNDRVILNYNDGFVNTAAVGSLLPNKLGIHDLSGNVYEWVSDPYSPESDLDVARGGSWASFNSSNLKSWSRFPTQKEFRDNLYGFRYVLVDTRLDDRPSE